MEQDNGRVDRGRFEGEVLARLAGIEQSLHEANGRHESWLRDNTGRITTIEVELGRVRAWAAAIAAVAAAAVAAVFRWLLPGK